MIAGAEALLMGAGAGMGVDSGLPDFRGNEGFWKAYPPFRGRAFAEMSNPRWFYADPAQAWGFFGHRLELYRQAQPHSGFSMLKRWMAEKIAPSFVFTSNVDGQFQKAGFAAEQILERHGSIHHLQCLSKCGQPIWEVGPLKLDIDPATFHASPPFPHCPRCGGLARPNILMFGDYEWEPLRTEQQLARYRVWSEEVPKSRVIAIELGAGMAIPTVRLECEEAARTVIRINPRDTDPPGRGIVLPLGAREALEQIDSVLKQLNGRD